ncbi:MAG: ATP-dependent helicase [Bacillota bacterium]|nr:ATP-dependent helicase [Bacillota bacterium]
MTYAEFKQTWGISLNRQQESAVQAVDGPVLLLAVPGSGKTTVLICRLGYMVLGRGIPPEDILTMTYTVAATRDMAERFAAWFGPELAARLEFRTINGVSARIIRYYERAKGRRAFQLISDEGRLSALVGELSRKATGEFATESTIRTIRTAITYIKNMQLTQEEIDQMWDQELPVGKIYRAYCAALREKGWMDYDDQMVYAARILRQYPDILAHFQGKYRYLCVDEAQDTSRIQHTIIRLLAGDRPNLFMVGDEDQSIYGFRAAYPAALMEFERVYPGGKVLLMERNYRSNAAIVEAAGQFIRQNRNRRDKTMTAARERGPDIQTLWAYDRADQYRYLVAVAKDCTRETAVLYRNNDSALPILDLLDRQGIGCRCRQVEGTFFSHRVVRDVMDIFALARNPADGGAFLRVYYKFRAGIPKAAAEKAVRESGGERPILLILAQMGELYPQARMRCKALHTHLTNMVQEPADRAVYRIRHFMGYGEYLEERGADQGKLDILEALGRQEPDPAGLTRRLEDLQGVVQAGSSDPESKFILSTIHASKGLEYDRVILMDVADGILPAVTLSPGKQPTQEEAESFEEERRLFYVGMTRARDHLAIFRFKKPGLMSTFAADVFPQTKEPEKKKGRVGPKSAKAAPKVDSAPYIPGTRVSHRVFGPGKLVHRQGDIATILFDSGEEKRFSLSTALKKQQLKRG